MLKEKKSLCVFIHFSEQEHIPYYVQVFVGELARFFDEVVLLINNKDLVSAPVIPNNVLVKFQDNKGYDFGRFYNYYKTINKDDYHRIACINDSNILINKLDQVLKWENIVDFDFWGLIDSYENPRFSKLSNSYHIQSHFLVFHKNAIDLLDEYFKSFDIDEFYNEKRPIELRHKVIENWEIGLSKFLKSQNLKIGSYINCEEFTRKFKVSFDTNLTIKLYSRLLENGYPLIKRRVVKKQKKSILKWRIIKLKRLIIKFGNPNWALCKILD